MTTDQYYSDLAWQLMEENRQRFQIRTTADICHPYALLMIDTRGDTRITMHARDAKARDLRKAIANGVEEAELYEHLLTKLQGEEETLAQMMERGGWIVGKAPAGDE